MRSDVEARFLNAVVESKMAVEFHEMFEDVVGDWQETYIEPGMRGHVQDIKLLENGNYQVIVDLSKFREFNIAFESNDWNASKDGKKVTTNAREAGFYKDIESFEFNPEKVEFYQICTPVKTLGTRLNEAYKASGSKMSYVEWLENKLEPFLDMAAKEARDNIPKP